MLILSLLGIAVIDSLNPSIILMTLFLLSTNKPTPRTASYIAAVFLTNWALGLLVYFGLGAALSVVISQIFSTTAWWAYALELVAAIALIYFAVTMKTTTDTGLKKKPASIDPKATFALGIGATFVEFSTAAPYFGALAALTKAAPPALYTIGSLALYNVVYVGIPLILFAVYVLKSEQAQPILTRINETAGFWIKRASKVVFFALGLLLLADFIGYLFGRPLLG